MTSSTCCAAPACIGARPKRSARWGRAATSRRSPSISSKRHPPPTRARPPSCWCAPGAERSTGSPTRTPPSTSQRALEALELAGAEAEAGPGAAGARGRAAAGGRARERARAVHRRRAARAPRGDPVLLAEAALGYAGLGIAIVDLDAETIARLEEALAALGSGSPVLRSRLLARLAGRALLRA